MPYVVWLLFILGLSLMGMACLFFRKPGVSFTEAALRAIWFGDPNRRLYRAGVLLQWLGLVCLIGAGLTVLSQQWGMRGE